MYEELTSEAWIFGSNFKVRCAVCCDQSGWTTLLNSNDWWKEHHFYTGHSSMAKFIRKL